MNFKFCIIFFRFKGILNFVAGPPDFTSTPFCLGSCRSWLVDNSFPKSTNIVADLMGHPMFD